MLSMVFNKTSEFVASAASETLPLITRMLQEEQTKKTDEGVNANRAFFQTHSKTGDLVLEILWVIILWVCFILYHGGRGYKKLKLKYDRKMAIIYAARKE